MKKTLLALCTAILLFASCARAQDSMAWFRSLIENARPEAADMGGWVAPEIYGVNLYPFRPAPGDTPVVRVMAGSWPGMVSYKVASVKLTWWKPGGDKTVADMKLIDETHGIYEAALPKAAAGDEVLYTVSVTDTWGNAAIQVPPGGERMLLVADTQDPALDPALDVLAVQAANYGREIMLCMELAGKPGRNIGADLLAYGVIAFSRDVRYKPSQTETELTSGWLAGHVPAFSISDLMPASDLAGALAPSKGPKKADFRKKDNQMCWRFDPATVRADYDAGLKVVGAALAVDSSSMALKISDTTRVTMLYPVVNSYRVR